MARVKGGMAAKRKHKRVLKLAKGYRGARSKQYRVAKQSVMRALASSYVGRKERKRQFRRLWIVRINAACRQNGLSYSRFMHGLKLAGIGINRKMLAEMAVSDGADFAALVELAKAAAEAVVEAVVVDETPEPVVEEVKEEAAVVAEEAPEAIVEEAVVVKEEKKEKKKKEEKKEEKIEEKEEKIEEAAE